MTRPNSWLAKRLLPGLLLLGLFGTPAEDEVKAAFERGRAAFERVDESDPASLQRAREALVEVFRAGTLDEVHGLLKDGTIGAEMSRKLAALRNGMIEEVRRELAAREGIVEVSNFSPAVNLLNDIDQAFHASDRVAEEGGEPQTGGALVAGFEEIWTKRFRIDPKRMDVVSHAGEATIPDWRRSAEVHDFVGSLRRGSRLLANNPEAYFLEGAYRLQVERRSFASDMELYSVYSRASRVPDGVAKVSAIVIRADGRISELKYQGVAPEVRASYSAGSTIGNWWFMNAHGGGTRYVAKYGLRSFSEGPGFLVVSGRAGEGELALPLEYEKLASYRERQAYCDDVWLKHFRDSGIPRSELFQTLETARVIRNAGDRFRPEQAFERRALELVSGDRNAYETNRDELLRKADLEFRESLTRVMIRNIEVTLPDRLGDWLDPHVDPRVLDLAAEDIEGRTDRYQQEMEKARKRLRTAALFETMHALRALPPAERERVIDSALADLRRRAGVREGQPYRFERAVRAVAKLAGAEARPRLLQLDEERLAERTRLQGGLAIEALDGEPIEKAPLEDQVREVRTELQDALAEAGLGGPRGVLQVGATELAARWARGVAEAERSLRARAAYFDPRNRTETVRLLREGLWAQLGWKAESEFEGVRSLVGAEATEAMRFDGRQLFDNVATMDNAQSVLALIDAYRKAGPSSEEKYVAVTNTLFTELATRLPYVGEAVQVSQILSGETNPITGAGLMLATFLEPGVGQVVAVYSLVDGTYRLLDELATEAWILTAYQGEVPNADGSPGPGRWTNVVGAEVPGMLEEVRNWMKGERTRLLAARDQAEGPERRELDILLTEVFTESLTVTQVRQGVYPYFANRLIPQLLESGVTPSELVQVQLDSFGDSRASVPPSELVEVDELPALIRAYLRPIVVAYFEGTGPYATLPGHAEARANPFLDQTYFHTREPSVRARTIEGLTNTLTAAYTACLLSKARGKSTRLVLSPRWDQGLLTASEAYLFGRPATSFAGLGAKPNAAPTPALPALLAPFGATRAEQEARFFPDLDAELDRKLARYAARKGRPAEEDFDEFKLGAGYSLLQPPTPESPEVAHPLLLSFFTKVVHDDWASAWRTPTAGSAEPAPDRPDAPGSRPDLAGGELPPPVEVELPTMDDLELPAPDTRSVGPSPLSTGFAQMWSSRELARAMTMAEDGRILQGVAMQLVRDYKRGMFQGIARHTARRERERLDAELPARQALLALSDSVFGNRYETSDDRALCAELAEHEGLPTLSLDENRITGLDAALRGVPDEVEIEISGTPTSPVGLGGSLQLQARVTAPDLFYERPFRVEWRLEGLDEGAREEVAGASEEQREHRAAWTVGSEESGIRERTVQVTAMVTDATGRAMGSSSVAFRIDPLEVTETEPEEEDAASPSPEPSSVASSPDPERPVKLVFYIARVRGSGWIPYYGKGSYVVSGHDDVILTVTNGQDPQQALEEYAATLVKPPCEAQIPGVPGRRSRPVFWNAGPHVRGIAGPFFKLSEARAHPRESAWTRHSSDGPDYYQLREKYGCR